MPDKGSSTPGTASNTSRIISILASFGTDNAPRRASDILGENGIPRATGFGLLRAMVTQGLLERADHGWLRLGARARALAFAPTQGNYAELLGARRIRAPSSARGVEHGVPRAEWDDLLTEMIDPAPYRRPGPYRLAFANASSSNAWRTALLESMKYGISVHADATRDFVIETADDDWRRQCEQVRALLAEQPDALIVSAAPGEDGSLSTLLAEARRAGTAIVSLDRRPRSADAALTMVTSSNATIGRTFAIWLTERLGGAGRIWMLSGIDGTSPAIRRQASALAWFNACPGIYVEAVAHTRWIAEDGHAAILSLMDDFGEPPDGVWCDSGLQGAGSIQAFLELGLTPPPHTGGDLNKMYKLAVHHRVPFVAMDYPATMGARAIETTLAILKGVPVPRRIEVPMNVILPRGQETASVKADEWAELHVQWGLPDNAVLSQGASVRRNSPSLAAIRGTDRG